ncbi:TetR/AcrR family transcriptional regulator [Mycobacteroides immunogenum]|uniref:TetR/AcrR family transcriptional regulator n=1 Tax=Mycobacteroides immunogenum TaxID=83262 RepID=UPI0025B747BE|nr:TetR/AcrR family transcriptional regulator [Mycobacteroides immunogenum]WJR35911.1 TetR/AcrR family transcriptional regulator [Mycobacteroides immunogenum]
MKRGYGGISAAQRSADRRLQLLDAALEAVGGAGYEALTVSGLCRVTGLNDRYFYEHFPNREAIFESLVEHLAEQTLALMNAAGNAVSDEDPRAVVEAGLKAFVKSIADDPRKARVIFVEAPARESRSHRTKIRDMFVALSRQVLDVHGKDVIEGVAGQSDLAGIYAYGGVAETITSWVVGDLNCTEDELLQSLTEIFMAIVNHTSATT